MPKIEADWKARTVDHAEMHLLGVCAKGRGNFWNFNEVIYVSWLCSDSRWAVSCQWQGLGS